MATCSRVNLVELSDLLHMMPNYVQNVRASLVQVSLYGLLTAMRSEHRLQMSYILPAGLFPLIQRIVKTIVNSKVVLIQKTTTTYQTITLVLIDTVLSVPSGTWQRSKESQVLELSTQTLSICIDEDEER